MTYRFLVIPSLIALLAACAGSPLRDDAPSVRERYFEVAGEPVNSFGYLGRLDGWRPLSKNELVVWAGHDKVYLLTVAPTCFDLEIETHIAVTSRMGHRVTSGMDDVLAGRDRCRIREIRPVDYERLESEDESRRMVR
jgi:hypothetical protein